MEKSHKAAIIGVLALLLVFVGLQRFLDAKYPQIDPLGTPATAPREIDLQHPDIYLGPGTVVEDMIGGEIQLRWRSLNDFTVMKTISGICTRAPYRSDPVEHVDARYDKARGCYNVAISRDERRRKQRDPLDPNP